MNSESSISSFRDLVLGALLLAAGLAGGCVVLAFHAMEQHQPLQLHMLLILTVQPVACCAVLFCGLPGSVLVSAGAMRGFRDGHFVMAACSAAILMIAGRVTAAWC